LRTTRDLADKYSLAENGHVDNLWYKNTGWFCHDWRSCNQRAWNVHNKVQSKIGMWTFKILLTSFTVPSNILHSATAAIGGLLVGAGASVLARRAGTIVHHNYK